MTSIARPATTNTRWKAVALPAEHGGWSFLFEPIILGLLLAPSLAGLCLAVAAIGAFLTRQPLKVALIDRRRGKRYARTRLAERFAFLYGKIAVLGFIVALILADATILIPLALAVPLVAIQVTHDARGRSRELLPELVGPLGLAAVGASIVLAAGWPLDLAFVVWAILAARVMPTVLYVRARLRLERDQSPNIFWPLVAHLLAVLVMLVLTAAGFAPLLAAIAMLILLVRAMWGLSPHRGAIKTKVLGFQEVFFGVVTVLLVFFGYQALF